MTGRAIHCNPFARKNWSPTLATVEARQKAANQRRAREQLKRQWFQGEAHRDDIPTISDADGFGEGWGRW